MSVQSDKVVGSDAVNKHISKPIPTTLWHYTSFRGFQGIVDSKAVWATEYRFLNDREEFLHAKQLAERLANEEAEFIGNSFPARDTLQKAVRGAFGSGHLHENRLRLMVASFTEEGDQLSQWRGYADDSRGISIGLNLPHLRPPPDIGTAVTFAPCLYGEEDKRALLTAVFAHHRSRLERWWNPIIETAHQRAGGPRGIDPEFGQKIVAEHRQALDAAVIDADATLRFDLLRIAPLLKNLSFSEEREWRLVLPLEPIHLPTRHPIQFRPTRDALVPYIAYPLRSPNQEGPIACREVILGPGSHPSAVVGVNMFLQSQDIPPVARQSRIPYRPT
jgi:hypothetical protein